MYEDHMAKKDLIFKKIIGNKEFANAYNIDSSKYPNLEAGKRALQPEVRAVSEIVHDINFQIEQKRADMRIRKESGPVTLDASFFQTLYRKIVSSITK